MNVPSLLKSPSSLLLCSITAIALGSHFLRGQGSLTPPSGAPGPTMKTLDEVRPGKALSFFPALITQPGNYYLTKGAAGSLSQLGVYIGASNVKLDLNGFTLSGWNHGIEVGNNFQGIEIRNGFVKGCNFGLLVTDGTERVLVEDMVAEDCVGHGFFLGAGGGPTVFTAAKRVHLRRCKAYNCFKGYTLFDSTVTSLGNIIEDCDAFDCEGWGFGVLSSGNLVIKNRAKGNATNYTIQSGNRAGVIVTPVPVPGGITTGGSGSGTTDPFANLSF